MKLDQKGYVTIVAAVALLLILISVAYLASKAFQTTPPMQVHRFEVNPSEFKASQTSSLYLKVESSSDNDFTTMTMHLETHENVEIYLGDTPLSFETGNYTYTKVLSPKEASSLMFKLKATVDIGDGSRNYRVKAYFYSNGEFFATKVASFVVYSDN